MTREQAIKRWADIAETIFWAEERIAQEWHEKLKEAPNLPKDKQHELAKAYCRAIAVEVVRPTPDEELVEME
jgi:hypothetical protein